MRHPIHSLIESRSATAYYDTSRGISDADIVELARLATCAPSAYNLQNWRIVAARSPKAKGLLQAAAYGQIKVAEAAVTFIVCGTLNAHGQLSQLLDPALRAGFMDRAMVQAWVSMAEQDYQHSPQLQRDEAIRSASLAAMTLILAAEGMGLATTPLGGFDSAAVTQAFGLADTELPVILVSVGYQREGNFPQKPRKALAEVMSLV